MSRPDWKKDGVPASEGGPFGAVRRRLMLALSSLAGAAAVMAVFALAGGDFLARASRPADPLPVASEEFSDSVADITAYAASGSVTDDSSDWVFNPLYHGPPLPHFAAQRPASGAPAMADTSKIVPLPTPNPLFATTRTTVVPLPMRRPLLPDAPGERMASLPPAPDLKPGRLDARPEDEESPAPAEDGGLALPTPGSGYAIYDIKRKMVYMPNGDQLEAHSGYGDKMDDIRHVSVRMLGPTPPNTYHLTMREALFHGVEALRLNPVGGGRMYGRTGFLTHSYLLGPRGDSNGCISFKDYDRFLAAYKRGEVKKMVVVASLPNAPEKPSPLLSWLLPKKK